MSAVVERAAADTDLAFGARRDLLAMVRLNQQHCWLTYPCVAVLRIGSAPASIRVLRIGLPKLGTHDRSRGIAIDTGVR
jgi:hypothetical protein